MKKRGLRSLLLALILIAIAGLLFSALARADQTTSSRAFTLNKAANLVRSVFGPTSPTPLMHNLTLSKARISEPVNNRTVIVMETEGDERGALTLALDVNPDGSISGGEWAFVATYVENIPGDPPTGDEDAGGELLIQKGTLSGAISAGNVTLNADQTIASVDSIQLSVEKGTLTFNEISSGNGNGQIINLQEPNTSSGTLSLYF
jgi:hypothetical protein